MIDKRTALVNQLRGLLNERGIIINQGITQVRQQLPLILEDAENGLTALSRELFAEQYERLKVQNGVKVFPIFYKRAFKFSSS